MAACTTPVWFQSLGNLPFSPHSSSRSQPPLSISNPHVLSFLPHGFRSEESTFQNLRPFPREKMGGGGQEEGREWREKPEIPSGNVKSVSSLLCAGEQRRETSERPTGTPPSVLTRDLGTKLALPLSDLGCSQVSSAP